MNSLISFLFATLTFATLLLAEEGFNFITIGDWGRTRTAGVPNKQDDVARQMDVWARENNAEFVLTLGDNFYPDGVFSADDEQFETKWRNVYLNPYPSLRVEWKISLGNHDHRVFTGHYQVEFGKTEPLWELPSFNYTFTKTFGDTSVFFVVVDSDSLYWLVNDTLNEQVSWLDETLEQASADWVIVAAHHPVYSSGHHGSDFGMIDDVRPILLKHNVDFYLAGHEHDLQHLNGPPGDSIEYVISGGGGASARPQNEIAVEDLKDMNVTQKMFNSINGFTGIKVKQNSITVEYVDLEGTMFYSFTKYKN
ncbi:DgyrCDS2249 [Dimorphilus gyrociliatus]|uniref:DgyrCDS2249 n=1 Tax=Dimorphilus gyrociliatus TaxID=2664684 RepID=A0A7I8VCR5_9ANNE|nr:DgyrCDS2249 [Dimorphilus gyrociliatus]